MRTKPLPPRDWLAARLDYDPDTGILTWKRRPLADFATKRAWSTWNTRFAGTNAGAPHTKGYLHFSLGGRSILAHRAAYYLASGRQPQTIDHKDRDKLNNRFNNLRECSDSENQWNRGGCNAKNTSGFRGVSWHAQSGKWQAAIRFKGTSIHLGIFTSIADAGAAAKAARKRLYGEFAGDDDAGGERET